MKILEQARHKLQVIWTSQKQQQRAHVPGANCILDEHCTAVCLSVPNRICILNFTHIQAGDGDLFIFREIESVEPFY